MALLTSLEVVVLALGALPATIREVEVVLSLLPVVCLEVAEVKCGSLVRNEWCMLTRKAEEVGRLLLLSLRLAYSLRIKIKTIREQGIYGGIRLLSVAVDLLIAC